MHTHFNKVTFLVPKLTPDVFCRLTHSCLSPRPWHWPVQVNINYCPRIFYQSNRVYIYFNPDYTIRANGVLLAFNAMMFLFLLYLQTGYMTKLLQTLCLSSDIITVTLTFFFLTIRLRVINIQICSKQITEISKAYSP